MNRDKALNLLKKRIKEEYLLKHALATEAIMRKLAGHVGEDAERWGLVGLLHDIDFQITKDEPEKHGLIAEKILRKRVDEQMLRAIKAHNFEHTGVMPETKMEKALIASDSITGLIVACALVMPSKKLREVTVETIKKKFKDKTFARGSSRERIAFYEKIGLSQEEFFKLSLSSLQEISEKLSL